MPVSLHREIGRLAVVGFEGRTVPPELESLAREFDLGGIILFRRNVESPEQVAEVAWQARQLSRELPLWVAVDQEGGRVARLRAPLTEWPPMMALGRADSEDLAARFAGALSLELGAVGVSLDFAPVLDVLTNASNPVIGDRAIAARADVVARLGATMIRAIQRNGVAACGKHFPGHGDTSVDSHHELPIVEHPPERLRGVEFEPFRAAIAADVAGIMMAHLLVPALDEGRPASLSPAIIGLLREELGFEGLVFSDDLDMKAVSGTRSVDRVFVSAIAAGCDVGLLCGVNCDAHAAAIEALIRAVEQEDVPRKRIDEAIARQRRAKERFAALKPILHALGDPVPAPLSADWRPPQAARLRGLVGTEEHQRVANDMRQYL